MSKFKVERYTHEHRTRPEWACQENDQDAYTTIRELKYRVVRSRDGKVLFGDLSTEQRAQDHIDSWLNPAWIKLKKAQLRKEYADALGEEFNRLTRFLKESKK